MILHVLDTDHISLFQRKHPTVVQNMVSADPNQLAVKSNTQPGNHKGLPLRVGLPHIDVGAIWNGCPESLY